LKYQLFTRKIFKKFPRNVGLAIVGFTGGKRKGLSNFALILLGIRGSFTDGETSLKAGTIRRKKSDRGLAASLFTVGRGSTLICKTRMKKIKVKEERVRSVLKENIEKKENAKKYE